jgi:hypothetical protein
MDRPDGTRRFSETLKNGGREREKCIWWQYERRVLDITLGTLIIRHSGQDRDEDVAGLSVAAGMQIKRHGNISCLSEKWLPAG